MKKVITYTNYGYILNELVEQIKKSEIKFDYIHGVPRGGLPIATHLSHHLDVPLWMSNLEYELNYKILVCDDVCDSGKTFKTIKTLYRSSPNIKFASLFTKPRSMVIPDFKCEEVPNEIWIVFPWEKLTDEPNKEYMFK